MLLICICHRLLFRASLRAFSFLSFCCCSVSLAFPATDWLCPGCVGPGPGCGHFCCVSGSGFEQFVCRFDNNGCPGHSKTGNLGEPCGRAARNPGQRLETVCKQNFCRFRADSGNIGYRFAQDWHLPTNSWPEFRTLEHQFARVLPRNVDIGAIQRTGYR